MNKFETEELEKELNEKEQKKHTQKIESIQKFSFKTWS